MSQDEVSEQADAVQISQRQILNITLLASEWRSSAGGLSTLNRELAIHLSQIQNVRVSLLVPEGACNDEDKREARSLGISILDAKECFALEPLLWLSNPPQDHKIDVIVGHGVKLGCQVQLIKRQAQFQNCKWVHVVHTAPEDLSKYKGYSSPISRGGKKHEDEVNLCKCADLVVPVGPKLGKAYRSYLQLCKKDEDLFVSLFLVFLSVSLEIYLQSRTPKTIRRISLCCCVGVVMRRILNLKDTTMLLKHSLISGSRENIILCFLWVHLKKSRMKSGKGFSTMELIKNS